MEDGAGVAAVAMYTAAAAAPTAPMATLITSTAMEGHDHPLFNELFGDWLLAFDSLER
jgi:hypothetical protein